MSWENTVTVKLHRLHSVPLSGFASLDMCKDAWTEMHIQMWYETREQWIASWVAHRIKKYIHMTPMCLINYWLNTRKIWRRTEFLKASFVILQRDILILSSQRYVSGRWRWPSEYPIAASFDWATTSLEFWMQKWDTSTIRTVCNE